MLPPSAVGILVIDDAPGVVNSVVRLLRRDGYAGETARHGREALALRHEDHDAVIRCDLRMPDLDGPAFYALLLRQSPSLPHRVMFLTGDTMRSESTTFLAQCGKPWVRKPCTAAAVRRAIAQVLHDAEPSSA